MKPGRWVLTHYNILPTSSTCCFEFWIQIRNEAVLTEILV